MKGSGSARNEPAAPAPFRFSAGTLLLELHVQPGAARAGWAGRHGAGALKLRVAAPALEGKANQACIRFLAQAAGVPQRAVTIVRGAHSRDKTIRIDSVSEDRFRALLEQWGT